MTGAGTSDQQWHACCARWVMRPSVAAIRPSRPDSPPPAPPAMAMNPEKSSPAEKARPSPDNTTARTEVSLASRAPASTRATNMSASSALSLSGRLSRTSATPPSVATVTRSVIAASRSPAHSAPRRPGEQLLVPIGCPATRSARRAVTPGQRPSVAGHERREGPDRNRRAGRLRRGARLRRARPGARRPAVRDRRAGPAGRDADRPRRGSAAHAAHPPGRRPAGRRGRHLHGVLVAVHRPRSRARWRADLLRRERGVDGDRPAGLGPRRVGRPHRAAHRTGPRHAAVAAGRAAHRPRLHRRRQGRLRGLLGRAVPRMRPGGLLLADNVLWSGRVVESPGPAEANEPDDNTRAIRAFNDHVAADDRVDVAVLPAFDGLTIARRR